MTADVVFAPHKGRLGVDVDPCPNYVLFEAPVIATTPAAVAWLRSVVAVLGDFLATLGNTEIPACLRELANLVPQAPDTAGELFSLRAVLEGMSSTDPDVIDALFVLDEFEATRALEAVSA